MATLKTNYVDDILNAEVNQQRKYQMINNDDGTVSFVDVTNYTSVGTNFGAKDINDTNKEVNALNESLQNVKSVTREYYGLKITLSKRNGIATLVIKGTLTETLGLSNRYTSTMFTDSVYHEYLPKESFNIPIVVKWNAVMQLVFNSTDGLVFGFYNENGSYKNIVAGTGVFINTSWVCAS